MFSPQKYPEGNRSVNSQAGRRDTGALPERSNRCSGDIDALGTTEVQRDERQMSEHIHISFEGGEPRPMGPGGAKGYADLWNL